MARSLWRRPLPLTGTAALVIGILVAWQQWRGPVVAAYRLEARPLIQTVVATGRVLAPTRVQIGSEITATVLERRVQEGDVVAAGDVLAVLRADDLAAKVREAEASIEQLERAARPQAEAALREARARVAQADRELQRRRELLERQLVARELVEQAEQAAIVARAEADTARVRLSRLALGEADETVLRERLAAAKAALAKTEIRASVAGTVLSRNAEPGDVVQPGTVLFEIARAGAVEILVPLDEKNLGVVAIEQTADCVADAYPAAPFRARLTLIAPKIDPTRGTVDVRLTVDSVPAFLREDMTVSVNIETARRSSAVVLPNDALLPQSGASAAVLAVRRGRAERVPIELGIRSLTVTEVKSGLSAGEIVLADTTIAPGRRVRPRLEMLPLGDTEAAPSRDLPLPPN
jgi:HlyD family secretion protein